MTPEQQKVVEVNMGLVGKVIRDKVHGLSQTGLYSYEDLFQIGCIGLCKAAATDKGGCFSTYAYRLIWNEICDALVRSTRTAQREVSVEETGVIASPALTQSDPVEKAELKQILRQAKKTAPAGVASGIRCLELMSQGYTSQEIGSIVSANPGTVRMWMTRARKYLSRIPELRQYACQEAA